jgi:plastocyanin
MSRFSLAAIAAIALVVAACSPEPSASEAPAGGASSAGAAGGGSGQVDVSLVDLEIDMPESVPAGEVTFNVTNDGGTEHGFEIEGSGIEEEIEELAPGDSDTLTVTLEPGTYTVYCPVDGHRGMGMELELEVTES